MTEERLKLHEKAEVKINAIIDTLSQDKGGLADKLKQEDVKDFLVSLWIDCTTEATKEFEAQIEKMKQERNAEVRQQAINEIVSAIEKDREEGR